MKVKMFLLAVSVFIAASALSAPAQQPQKGEGMMHPGMHEGMHGDMQKPMDPAAMEEMRKNMDAHRKEMHSIMLDEIALIKDMAMTPEQKKRAEDLEKRIKAHIDTMEKMHMQNKMGKGK